MTSADNFKVFYDEDADLKWLLSKKVAVIGYGSQGHAHALNLRESEVAVTVGLPLHSASRARAEAEGLPVLTPSQAAAWADVVMMLVPDEVAAEVFQQDIAPNLKPGDFLAFAHGFNVHFGSPSRG